MIHKAADEAVLWYNLLMNENSWFSRHPIYSRALAALLLSVIVWVALLIKSFVEIRQCEVTSGIWCGLAGILGAMGALIAPVVFISATILYSTVFFLWKRERFTVTFCVSVGIALLWIVLL